MPMIEPPLTILIGGAPRTGKSILAASLFEVLGCLVIHGDTLVNAIKNNYPGAFGVDFETLLPEDHAAKMIPIQLFLKKVIRNMGKDIAYPAKIFESCYLHPQTAAALAKEGPVISVFLLYGNFMLRSESKISEPTLKPISTAGHTLIVMPRSQKHWRVCVTLAASYGPSVRNIALNR